VNMRRSNRADDKVLIHLVQSAARPGEAVLIRLWSRNGKADKTAHQTTAVCPKCNRGEMCLRGIETESDVRDLYTFECDRCGAIEVRGVRVKWESSGPMVVARAVECL
jgi:DNA-directed RNA polymerase subunit M/transcription elongation factor TFIIS